jgi:hypothetical protein
MGMIKTASGEQLEVKLDAGVYQEAFKAKLSVPAYINRKYPTLGAKEGPAFTQLCAYEGIYLPKAQNPDGLRAQLIGDIFDGSASMAAITQQRGDPYGGQSRLLFPAAVIDLIENQMPKDLDTDKRLFDQMVAVNLNIASDIFEQPIINYSTVNGPDGTTRAKAQRIAQLAEPAALASFTTSDTPRKLNSWSIGAEFSQQSLRSTTLDLVALALGRFLRVEQDGRVFQYLNNLFTGDKDLNTGGAISAVTSTTLNGSATAGVLTHKAWLKWLYRNRKYRKLDFIVCDIDTYLKIEARTGRPGSIGVLDPTLPKIDPQATALNPYVDNVKVFLVDAAADGGPVPANTVWGLDSRDAIVKVTNTQAAYQAAEQFALKRSEAFRIDWSEDCYRQWDMAFDVLTID